MKKNDFYTNQSGKLKIIDMLKEQDCSIPEMVEESGLTKSTVNNFIKQHQKRGNILCVSTTQRVTKFGQVGSVAARYIWDAETEDEKASSIISRMLDLLLDTTLNTEGLQVVRMAQTHIGRCAI